MAEPLHFLHIEKQLGSLGISSFILPAELGCHHTNHWGKDCYTVLAHPSQCPPVSLSCLFTSLSWAPTPGFRQHSLFHCCDVAMSWLSLLSCQVEMLLHVTGDWILDGKLWMTKTLKIKTILKRTSVWPPEWTDKGRAYLGATAPLGTPHLLGGGAPALGRPWPGHQWESRPQLP